VSRQPRIRRQALRRHHPQRRLLATRRSRRSGSLGSQQGHPYLQARYRRLAARRGKKRALVAVGPGILIAIWHMLSNDIDYQDLGPDHFRNRVDPAKQASRLVHQLGYQAVLTPVG
jgi:hypothetical protein